MTLFKEKRTGRLYTIQDWGIYGLYATSFLGYKIKHLKRNRLSEEFDKVAII